MSWLQRVPGIREVHEAVKARAGAVWRRDRATLRGLPALGTRVFRIAIVAVRGVVAHRLSLLAAALTFFTVFSIVPMLVVVLWALKLLDHLPALPAALPASSPSLTGDQLLHAALAQILQSVRSSGEFTGIVGLLALLYVATKMFSFTERALHIIAGAGSQTPRFARALGYLALFFVPPVMVALSGLLLAATRRPVGREIYGVVRAIPGFELALGALLALGGLWLAVTLLYGSAVRAQIPFRSAAVGGAVAALALPVVFWAYANLQIGVSNVSPLGSGFLAFPVFLLWAFSSWYTLLVGAEIAVAHHVDVVLLHGARTFHLDLEAERQASAAIAVRAAQAGLSGSGRQACLSADELARDLRLPPQVVSELCLRLVDRGVLKEERSGFSLRPDPDRTLFGAVLDAVERDPALEEVRREAASEFPSSARAALSAGRHFPADGGPTLGEVASERAADAAT